MAKLTTEKVKESQRSKDLSSLETTEEIQKDIQRMYSDAKKIVTSSSKAPMKGVMDSVYYSMKHYVVETKDVKNMNVNQVSKFWNGAYSHLERLKELSKEK